MTVILLAGMALSWPVMQDDALIHLRYAAHLHDRHFITYDGLTPSYGTSSLLYVALLAALRSIIISPILPRIVSSVVHLLLFAALAYFLNRRMTAGIGGNSARVLAFGLLVVLILPSALRWLEDGMETGLTLAAGLLCIVIVDRTPRRAVGPQAAFGLLALGAGLVLLRIELLLLAAVCSLMLYSEWARLASKPHSRLATALPFAGGMIACTIMAISMHALLPDTALAKSSSVADWRNTLHQTFSLFVSALSFGLGLLCLWILSLITLLSGSRLRAADLLANSLFPVTLVLACLRGQQIAGVRYFAWTLFFAILWNLNRCLTSPAVGPSRPIRLASTALLMVLVIALPLEAFLLRPVFGGRAQGLAAFRSQHLERLAGQTIVAEDVGFIGYFTQAKICDINGLVNGRAFARLSTPARFNSCLAERPQLVFANLATIANIANRPPGLAAWSICGVYDFDNLRAADPHYLIAPPELTSLVCSAAGQSPRLLAPLLYTSQRHP